MQGFSVYIQYQYEFDPLKRQKRPLMGDGEALPSTAMRWVVSAGSNNTQERPDNH